MSTDTGGGTEVNADVTECSISGVSRQHEGHQIKHRPNYERLIEQFHFTHW